MRLRFRTNLGSQDAQHFGVDHTKCTIGATGTFDEKTAEGLIKLGVAEEDKGEAKDETPAPEHHAHAHAEHHKKK